MKYHVSCKFILQLILLILFIIDLKAQNIDSLIQVISHSHNVERINDSKKNLPEHITKIDMNMLNVIRIFKSEGISRSNISQKDVHNRFSNNILQVNDNGDILAEIYLNKLDFKTIDLLLEYDIKIENIDELFKRVTCMIPFDIIEKLAISENTSGISCIPKTITEIGQYTTAGDGILSASITRTNLNIDGSGVKVGIISDGVNHYQNAISSGDLPSNFQIINNRIGGDEGTAMSEIVYDIAPGVSLAFSDHFYGESGIVNSINALRDADCDILLMMSFTL